MKALVIVLVVIVGFMIGGLAVYPYLDKSEPVAASSPTAPRPASQPSTSPPIVSRPLPTRPGQVDVLEEGRRWRVVIDPRIEGDNSGIIVPSNTTVTFSISGELVLDPYVKTITPPGAHRIRDMEYSNGFPDGNGLFGQLLVSAGGERFALHTRSTTTFSTGGSLVFLINDRIGFYNDNSGNYEVIVEIN